MKDLEVVFVSRRYLFFSMNSYVVKLGLHIFSILKKQTKITQPLIEAILFRFMGTGWNL